jgi:hypothetical protein
MIHSVIAIYGFYFKGFYSAFAPLRAFFSRKGTVLIADIHLNLSNLLL